MSPIPPRRRGPRFSGAASSPPGAPARAPAGTPSRHPFREEARAPAPTNPYARPDRHEGPRRQAAPAPERRDLRPVLFMPCAMGVESLLQEELAPLLAHLPLSVVADRGGVLVHSNQPAGRAPIDLPFDFESSLAATVVEAVFIINLHSRLAQRVLWRVALGPYASEDQIYHLARCVDWNDWITPEHTLRVDVTARHSPLQSLNFAGLRIKDAVCDALRDQHGERPSVELRHPDLQLQLHLDENAAYLYVDTSGEALFKRGWREDTGEAPLKETLAAAMLAAAGWKGRAEDGALLDPCCGSGTIAIEAAQIACGMAAGMLRRFAFEQLSPFAPHEAIWTQLIDKAKAQVREPKVRIYTGDVSFRMTDFATRNAERAGVMHAIEFKTADALQRMPPEATGLMMFNPPYGERIDPKGTGHGGQRGQGEARAVREDFTDRDAGDFFSRMASHWKKNYPGWTAWVLSPDMKLPSAMRLKEGRRIVMFNGPIECRLFRFDLVAGSLRSDTASNGAGADNAPSPRRAMPDPDED